MDILRHLLFENPLTPCIVLGLVALGAGFFWSRTGSRRARTMAVACCLAAAALLLVAWAVETDQERVARTLWIMSDAASRGDADTLIAQISPEYEGGPHGKDGLAAVVRLGLSQVRATADEPDIRIEAAARLSRRSTVSAPRRSRASLCRRNTRNSRGKARWRRTPTAGGGCGRP